MKRTRAVQIADGELGDGWLAALDTEGCECVKRFTRRRAGELQRRVAGPAQRFGIGRNPSLRAHLSALADEAPHGLDV